MITYKVFARYIGTTGATYYAGGNCYTVVFANSEAEAMNLANAELVRQVPAGCKIVQTRASAE